MDTERFESILRAHPGAERPHVDEATVHDLALDQTFAQISDGAPRAMAAFRHLLTTSAEVEYRQDVFRGLEHPPLKDAVEDFLRGMADCDSMDQAASQARYPYEAQLCHLGAVIGYTGAVGRFCSALTAAVRSTDTRSQGWDQLARHLDRYRSSAAFASLHAEATRVREQLDAVSYNVLIHGPKVTIAATDDEDDLGAAVVAMFERFRHTDVKDHRVAFRPPELDHVQAWVLERVAQVRPEPFEHLLAFAQATGVYRDPLLARFTDEVRFYLAYLDYIAPMRRSGLPTTFPEVGTKEKTLQVQDAWDIALAAHLVEQDHPVVTNDLSLSGSERILVISGPNQGGKTTTARMFGQIHYLAAIGCPVPGRDARVFLCDQVLTMFEREEQLETLEGRLGAEVHRLHELFEIADTRTVLVINEAFASTALHDARILTRDVLQRVSDLDAVAVCVTFIDELSRLNERTVSMVSTVDPSDPAVRTYRVERRRADGRAYARALAAKHGLTLNQVADRLNATDRSRAVGAEEGVR